MLLPPASLRWLCWALLLGGIGAPVMTGCVERELVATSEPSGALVTMNDQEVSRTPLAREFQWYGTYDVSVRATGYETLRTRTPVIAPPWLWFPLDLVTELLPFRIRDVHEVHYKLRPTSEVEIDPHFVVERATDLKSQLETGKNYVAKTPSTRPSKKKASTRPTTRPSSQPAPANQPSAAMSPQL